MIEPGIPLTMTEPLRELLLRLSPRYIWWELTSQSPQEDPLPLPKYLIARIMHYQVAEDRDAIEALVGRENLIDILRWARIGEFDLDSWKHWHYRLGLVRSDDELPPLPNDRFRDWATFKPREYPGIGFPDREQPPVQEREDPFPEPEPRSGSQGEAR